MAEHRLTWTAPAPFWEALAATPDAIRDALPRPEILRFASDTFMEEMLTALARDPAALRGLAVRHETWRGPETQSTGVAPEAIHERPPSRALKLLRLGRARRARAAALMRPTTTAETYKLKLYQPANLRYYLVSSCLVCAIPGFPDREVDAGQQERVSFLLRRLFPADPARFDRSTDLPDYDPEHPEIWEEYAFVAGAAGSEWRKVPKNNSAPLEGEERLPLFPMVYPEEGERKRRLFCGLVPAGRRDTYMGAPPQLPAAQAAAAEPTLASRPRIVQLHTDVLAPWKALAEQSVFDENGALVRPDGLRDKDHPSLPNPVALKSARAQMQTASWYALLDLAKYLQTHVKPVWTAIAQGSPRPADPALALLRALEAVTPSASLITDLNALKATPAIDEVATSLADALKRIVKWEDDLEKVTRPFDFTLPDANARWPDFLFLLRDPWHGPVLPNLLPQADPNDTPIERALRKIDALADLFEAALDPQSDEKVPQPTPGAAGNIDMREGWFVMRCVYERPECGPLHEAVVSAPTRAFQLASFFDPDAPARPIRIGLPIDTTPAGLRKFDKKAAFMMSDILCGQLDRMKGIGLIDLILHILPWPLHKELSIPEKGPCSKGGASLGMMCSLSIPIVTLCALILLLIIVSLLDFIFRWLPWLVVCFPVPGFKGKR